MTHFKSFNPFCPLPKISKSRTRLAFYSCFQLAMSKETFYIIYFKIKAIICLITLHDTIKENKHTFIIDKLKQLTNLKPARLC